MSKSLTYLKTLEINNILEKMFQLDNEPIEKNILDYTTEDELLAFCRLTTGFLDEVIK